MTKKNLKKRDQLKAELKRRWPKMWLKNSEEFNGAEGGLWSGAGASGEFFSSEWYFSDPQEKEYVAGVRRDVNAVLDEYGFFAEFQDPETILIWPI